MDKLEKMGFIHWFKDLIEADKAAAHEFARVVEVHNDRYTLNKSLFEVIAELYGNLL